MKPKDRPVEESDQPLTAHELRIARISKYISDVEAGRLKASRREVREARTLLEWLAEQPDPGDPADSRPSRQVLKDRRRGG